MGLATESNDAPVLFYRGAGVVDGMQAGLRSGVGLLVQDGRVLAVGTSQEVCPAHAQRIDLGDGIIVPGFVDAHTHVTIRPGEGGQHEQLQGPPAWQTVRGVRNLQDMLRSGVTTARIMTEEHDIDVHFKAAIAAGEVAGPRLRVAGRGLSPPGKHGGAVRGVAGPAALREAVRANAAVGADHIKIFTTGGVSSVNTSLEESNYSAEEIVAIVETAAAHGLTVSAHAHGGAGVDLAVDNGVHSIEHGALMTQENVAAVARNDAWVVLTNTILFHPTGIEQGDAREPAILAKVLQARESMAEAIRHIRAAGIPVALGTDSMHGLFGYEMQWLVEHGWSPEEALRAGTSGGAELCGDSDVGTLSHSKRADFVVLRGDPTKDITAVYEIEGVYQGGQRVVDAHGVTRPCPPLSDPRHEEHE